MHEVNLSNRGVPSMVIAIAENQSNKRWRQVFSEVGWGGLDFGEEGALWMIEEVKVK